MPLLPLSKLGPARPPGHRPRSAHPAAAQPAPSSSGLWLVAVLGLALVLGLLAAPPGSHAQTASGSVLGWPSTSAPAAGEAGEVVDLGLAADVPAGDLVGAIRPVGDDSWQTVPIAHLADPTAPGAEVATLELPDHAEPGTYDLRVQVLDDDTPVAEQFVAGGLVVEDHGFMTGFEARDGASWTTHAEEVAYLEAVAAASPRVALDRIGSSGQGRPMHLMRIAEPGPPAMADLPSGRTVLFACSQHGNEPAPRESCLRELRRLAFTQDSRTVEYLRDTTVLFLPTANPDGRELNIRGNANGDDLNRDHLRLATPEGRVMSRMLRDVRPDVLADLHEFSGSVTTRPMFEYIWARHLNVDTDLRQIAVDWGQEWLRHRLDADGFTSRVYQANPGTGENVTLINAAALRHSIGVLTESQRNPLPGEQTTAETQWRRVAGQDLAIRETLRFHERSAERIDATIAASIERSIDDGIDRRGPYFWYGNSEDLPQLPPADAMLQTPPCGYILTRHQADQVAEWLDAFDIRTVPYAVDQVYVPMAQPDRPSIGLKLDDRGPSADVAARPWPTVDRRPDLPCATDRFGFDPRRR